MNLKKIRKQLLVTLSLFIGIMPFLTKLNNSKTKASSNKSLSLFDLIGEWESIENTKMKIDENATIHLNEMPIQLTVKEAQQNQMSLQDRFGYTITITKTNPNNLSLYDEAEDTAFSFRRIS